MLNINRPISLSYLKVELKYNDTYNLINQKMCTVLSESPIISTNATKQPL